VPIACIRYRLRQPLCRYVLLCFEALGRRLQCKNEGASMTSFINLPGIGNSGEGHWQTYWEASDSRFTRFDPASWDEPDLADWISALDRATGRQSSSVVLVAHSLACLLIGHWAHKTTNHIAGAFLVAVPDPTGDDFPQQAASFKNVPAQRLPFPALVIASSNDPYSTLDTARTCAAGWGCPCVDVGEHGHINDVGSWEQGKMLLTAFAAGTSRPG